MSLKQAAFTCVVFLYAIPSLGILGNFPVATATSIEFALSNDIDDEEIKVSEGDSKDINFNYTVKVSGASNPTLALAVCATVDHRKIAVASVSRGAVVPLHVSRTGTFRVNVKGLFLGRASLHVHFVVSPGASAKDCENEETQSLHEMFEVSESNRGKEQAINVSKAGVSSDQSSSSKVVGMHSGRQYPVVVVIEDGAIHEAFRLVVVGLVMIINVGMGCKLDLDVVKQTLRRPLAPLTGLFSQFLFMPLISYAVGKAFNLEPAVALGLFAVGCAPGGSLSNSICYLLGGDVSLSITMTFISTVVSMAMVPLWLYTLGRQISEEHIKIPFDNIIVSLLGLTAAVALGLLLKYKARKWARITVTISKVVFVLLVVYVLTMGVYTNLHVFKLMTLDVLVAAALLPYGGFFLGGIVALLCRMSAKNVVTIAVETGIQNSSVATVLMMISLEPPESDRSLVGPAASAIFTPIPLWIAIAVVQIRRRCCLKIAPDDSATTEAGEASARQESNSPPPNTTTTTTSLWKKLFGKGENGNLCRLCLFASHDEGLKGEHPAAAQSGWAEPRTGGASDNGRGANPDRSGGKGDNPATSHDAEPNAVSSDSKEKTSVIQQDENRNCGVFKAEALYETCSVKSDRSSVTGRSYKYAMNVPKSSLQTNGRDFIQAKTENETNM